MEEENQNEISGTNSEEEEAFETPLTNTNNKNTYIISHSDSLDLKDSKIHFLTSEDGNVSDKKNSFTFGQPCTVEINDSAKTDVPMSVLSLYEVEKDSLFDAEK